MHPRDFLRAWSGDRALCSAPVVAWLAQHGAALELDSAAMRTLWESEGCEAASLRLADELGLAPLENPALAQAGDPVIVLFPDAGATLALCIGAGFAGFITIDRKTAFVRAPFLHAWNFAACRN